MSRPKSKSKRTSTRRPARPARRPAAAAEPVAAAPLEALVPPPAAVPEPIVVSAPELVFASRRPEPALPRPLPAVRRGIFFDVENSSRPEHVAAVLEHLSIDRGHHLTDLLAVGNWKVASPETARYLAQRGAQLIHSAPSTGVKDWSDLRIAVAAGVWLAGARPGDTIEIITDDQAFDAVGDVAAGLGVLYQRLSFRNLAGMGVLPAAHQAPAESRGGGGRGRRRGRRGRGGERHGPPRSESRALHPAPHREPAAPSHRAAPAAATGEAHTAPAEEIRAVVDELLRTSPMGITLDALSNALKSRGFRRTPGSPRLITRLRNLKGIEVTRAGIVRLMEGAGPAPAAHRAEEAPRHHVAQLAGMPQIIATNFDRPSAPAAVAIEERGDTDADTEADEDESSGPGNEAEPGARAEPEQGAEPGAGRRRRRGGRRRRGRRGRGGSGVPGAGSGPMEAPAPRSESA
jgi:hypothetical protein